MADVFICYYAGSAGAIVKRIASELKKHGISCWYAEKSIYEGDFVGQITREIRECKIFLLILNEDALKSRYMESEVSLAFRRVNNYEKLTFLPFRVDDCDLEESPQFTYFLGRTQIMDGNPPDEAHIEKLVQRIVRLTGEKPPAPLQSEAKRPAPLPSPSAPKRRPFLWWFH